jgi:hypothetical protein
MNRTSVPKLKLGNRLWGIYHENVGEQGNPLRTVVKARSKIAAEELAARLGFGEPWAHPVSAKEAKRAQWLPIRRAGQRQPTYRHSTGTRV